MEAALIYIMLFLIDKLDFSIFAHISVVFLYTVADQLYYSKIEFLYSFNQYQDWRILQLRIVLDILFVLLLLHQSDQSLLQLVKGNFLSTI